MIGRLVAAVAGVTLMLAGCTSSNSGLSRDTSCGHSTHGALCVTVMADSSRVRDVIAYYTPVTSLVGKTWRLSLLRYPCNPAASRRCRPSAQYPARARSTPPPPGDTCLAQLYDSGRRRCAMRLAAAYGSFGDFDGLRLPLITHDMNGWLCVSAQVAQGRGWRDQFARSAACYH
jgi:hypothetical protein